jgi:ActR/RegA family two-component response regulator
MEYDPTTDRPYHETVIALLAAIDRADQAQAVADFIIATTCPANHDAIAALWREVLDRLAFPTDIFGVIAAMEAKKAHAAKQIEKKLAAQRLSTELSRRVAMVEASLADIGLRLSMDISPELKAELSTKRVL